MKKINTVNRATVRALASKNLLGEVTFEVKDITRGNIVEEGYVWRGGERVLICKSYPSEAGDTFYLVNEFEKMSS